MSWVRWSTPVSKGVTSDLYIYDSVGDFISVNVASRKRVALDASKMPMEPDAELLMAEKFDEYVAQTKTHDDWWDEKNAGINFNWVKLPESHAGKNEEFTDVESLIKWLNEAKAAGVVFPEYVFEQAEEAKEEYAD